MGERIKTLAETVKGTVKEILAEEIVPALTVEALKEAAMDSAIEVTGIISPRIGTFVLAYQKKRWERNINYSIDKLVANQDELNVRLEKLEEWKLEKYKEVFPLIFDYIPNEKQKEKIDFIVNGLVNLASGIDFQEDVTLMYYDTLNQLTLLDIRVLKYYTCNMYMGNPQGETLLDIMRECNIDSAQMGMIKEKLAHLGLLESKNDADMDSNIRAISEYLEAVSKGKKTQKLRLKKISKSESYKATSFGRKFIDFFTDINFIE